MSEDERFVRGGRIDVIQAGFENENDVWATVFCNVLRGTAGALVECPVKWPEGAENIVECAELLANAAERVLIQRQNARAEESRKAAVANPRRCDVYNSGFGYCDLDAGHEPSYRHSRKGNEWEKPCVTKVAEILGVHHDTVRIVWKQGQYATKISDIEANGMRPTRATWAKLMATDLPIWSYANE